MVAIVWRRQYHRILAYVPLRHPERFRGDVYSPVIHEKPHPSTGMGSGGYANGHFAYIRLPRVQYGSRRHLDHPIRLLQRGELRAASVEGTSHLLRRPWQKRSRLPVDGRVQTRFHCASQ